MGSKRGRISNSMSADEVRRASGLEELSWSEFEKKVTGAIRANGWEYWADRVIPAGAFQGLQIPRPVMGRLLKIVNSYQRKRGLIDRLVWKRFESGLEVPERIAPLLGNIGSYLDCPLVVFGAIEIKTGSATETSEQADFLHAAALCPGMFSLTVYPQGYDTLCEILGGERP